jgi:hypothetical protein
MGWASVSIQLILGLQLTLYPHTEWEVDVNLIGPFSERLGKVGSWLRDELGLTPIERIF